MDQLAAMRMFRRVVEAGGFSAAADTLNISHTIVSRQVRQLEETLGAQLLNRTTRRFSLTEIGAGYYRRCVDILEQVDEAARQVAQHQERPSGLLRINAPMAFGTLELPQWLPQFMQHYPELHIDLVCNDRFVDLIAEEFDVGLRITRKLPDSSLIAKRLCTSDMLLVAAPAYLQRWGTPQHPQDLMQHNYLAYSLALQSTELSFADAAGQLQTVQMRGSMQANNGDIVCAAVKAGIGITASASFVVHEAVARGEMVVLLPGYQLQPRELYAVYPQSRHLSPKVRAFVDFVAGYYATPRWV
ncbi:LysR family transcriptional regulator [Herbaspirillum lusitanum]|uniref:LysR family transcriptional regulator n=1 Tax=Herbaspirillum lusitanum TaxID=213312 RepID=A0ABW9A5L7_9BURK